VIRLNSVPQLGIEHAAYRVEADGKSFWVDCPSTFDRSLPSVDAITFTHHHFLGASNQYRALFTAEVAIHKTDSRHEICWGFPFDRTFTADFTDRGLEAVHLAGHTPGFTAYLFDDTLFVCDYVLFGREKAFLNPYGPQQETAEGLRYLLDLMNDRDLRTVCGVDYVMDFPDWRDKAAPLAR
jgi:glyoxylase-like metal-dependent hydrolase (beta-lactamase superfamily II)